MDSPKSYKFFTNQFKKSDFLFTDKKPQKLATAECSRWDFAYAVYRALWAIWWVALFLWDINATKEKLKFWLYLTNWTYVSITISSVAKLVTILYKIARRRKQQNEDTARMPFLYLLNWILNSLTINQPIMVTPLYLAGQIPGGEVHYVPTVYVLIDMFINGIPIRLLHVWLPQLFGLVYIITTVIYWAATGDVIYAELDYGNKPAVSFGIVVLVFVVIIPACQLVLFCLFWIKSLIYNSCECPCMSEPCWKRKTSNEDYVVME